MKVGVFLTNQNPVGSDMVSALEGQLAMIRLARDRGWDLVATGQHYLTEGASQLQLVPFLARLAAEAGHMTGVAGILLLGLHNPVEVAEIIASLAGSLLAAGVADAIRTGRPVADCLGAAAHAAGRRIGERSYRDSAGQTPDEDEIEAVTGVFARHGYKPRFGPGDEVALVDGPCHCHAEQERPPVCGMNLDFVNGIIDGIGRSRRLTARLAPERGYCCVRLTVT